MANAVRQRTDRVRLTAYSVLSAVSSRDAYANLLLTSALRDADLHGKDAALATELVYGTLRSRGCYDAIISLCADRPLGQIDPAVLDALRLGAHQSARHADQIARGRCDHGRSGDQGGRAAALGFRERRAAPDRAARPRVLDPDRGS